MLPFMIITIKFILVLDFLIKKERTVEIVFFKSTKKHDNNNLIINLNSKIEQLDEVVDRANKKKIFQIKRMQDYEGTSRTK